LGCDPKTKKIKKFFGNAPNDLKFFSKIPIGFENLEQVIKL